MKHIAALFIVFAFLVTTDKIVSIKTTGDTATIQYQAYCTTQNKITPDAKGRYIVTTPTQTIYVPVAGTRIETVNACP